MFFTVFTIHMHVFVTCKNYFCFLLVLEKHKLAIYVVAAKSNLLFSQDVARAGFSIECLLEFLKTCINFLVKYLIFLTFFCIPLNKFCYFAACNFCGFVQTVQI